MDISTSLLKTGLKTSLVEAMYNEVLTNTNNYYYFVGKTLPWNTEDVVTPPETTLRYESLTRNEIIFFKKISSADVSYVIPRYNWVYGDVFDMYDDYIGGQIVVSNCNAVAGSTQISGNFDLSLIGVGVKVTGTNIAAETLVTAVTANTVTINNKTLAAVVGDVTFTVVSTSGAETLDTSKFYCITTDNNVYKCIDNNKGAKSTVKPYATSTSTLRTQDGYLWKFMYTIPVSLVNRFMTTTDMPVATAVKSQYYSRGAITSATIQNSGIDYQPGDRLLVNGNGYLRDNPLRVVSCTVDDAGYGYLTPPTLTVADPFTTVPFVAGKFYLSNEYVKAGKKIYQVIASGAVGSSIPTHTSSDPIYNGAASLKFVGLSIDANAVLNPDGSIAYVALSGIVGYINIDQVGSGYDPEHPPEITIVGDGANASATVHVSQSGYISGVTIANRGTGYTYATALITSPVSGQTAVASIEVYHGYGYSAQSSVTATEPRVADVAWSAGGLVNFGNIVQVDRRFYQVTSAGVSQVLGSAAPQFTSGSSVNGAATLQFVAMTALLSVFTEKTNAKMTPVIESGKIVNAVIQDGGEGYTTATITAYGTGTGAQITPNLSYGDLNMRQASVELLATPGTIDFIAIVNPGSSWVYANVQVQGDGAGCTAEAVITNGMITSINVTNPGYGYTKATVTITGNESASPAFLRPIIAPATGHGKNAVRELFAKDVTMATTISQDLNQGFAVSNNYRQTGILKNPQEFTTTRRYDSFSGSACFTITGDFIYTDLINDEILTITLDVSGIQKQFIIVAKPVNAPATGEVTLLVQSLDNAIPEIGQVVRYGMTGQATVTAVSLPTIDKYSGELLFINNRNAYMPTADQTVSIKTAIRL